MTIEEFNKISFAANMTAVYKEKGFHIVSCDFEDKTIGIQVGKLLIWISCKNLNVKLHSPKDI